MEMALDTLLVQKGRIQIYMVSLYLSCSLSCWFFHETREQMKQQLAFLYIYVIPLLHFQQLLLLNLREVPAYQNFLV